MPLENLDFACHRDIDNKFTYTLPGIQILLLQRKRLNKINLKKLLKHKRQTGLGTKSVFRVFYISLKNKSSYRCLDFYG